MRVIINKPVLRILFFLPQAVIMTILALIVRHTGFNLREKLMSFSGEELEIISGDEIAVTREKEISSSIYLVIVFLITQGLFIIFVNWAEKFYQYFNINSFFNSTYFINIIVFILTFALILLVMRLVDVLKIQRDEMVERIREKTVEKMNWELKMQQHDFNHHLGMLHMLLIMDQYKRAKEYLNGVVGEMESLREVINSGNEILNALLYSKINRAKKYGVQLNVNIVNPIKSLKIKEWDLNRIIGNLLDNAIEASLNADNIKEVNVSINSSKLLKIEVETMGVIISDEVEKHIFERGFSSKIETGHGLGLAICKELVDIYNGKIYIEKDYERKSTLFILKLPYLDEV
jgi:two-component system, LytTR family, sensor histidine kinase AgrC